MDTTTVLAIIEMIDTRCNNADEAFRNGEIEVEDNVFGNASLQDLKRHLESFIEGQVNAVENQTTE